MSAVSETIVREYFELNGFLVRQQRKYIAQGRSEDDEIDFFVLNPQPRKPETPLPFVLATEDLSGIARADRGGEGLAYGDVQPRRCWPMRRTFFGSWNRRCSSARRKIFGDDGSLTKILVVPALPQGEEARAESIELLRSKGIDGVIPFRTILGDLIEQTEVNRNYQKSDVLQMIRVLKNYDFFKEPQMELFKTKRRRKKKPEN